MNWILRSLGTAALVSTISVVNAFSTVSPALGLQTASASVEADEEPGEVVPPNFNDFDGDKITSGKANSFIKQTGGGGNPPPQCPPPDYICVA